MPDIVNIGAAANDGTGDDFRAAFEKINNAFGQTLINAQTGTTYTLVIGDAGKLVTLANANAITLTVPLNSSVAFPVGTVVACAQLLAGLVSIAGAAGVTINGTDPGAEASSGQWAAWSLTKLATDTWLASGGLA